MDLLLTYVAGRAHAASHTLSSSLPPTILPIAHSLLHANAILLRMAFRVLYFSASLAVVAFVLNFVLYLDVNKRIYNHRPGQCHHVEGPLKGAESVVYVHDMNIAFISSGVYYMTPRPNVIGQIFLYDLTQTSDFVATPIPIELSATSENFTVEKFHPHGISYIMVDGKINLYAVAHTTSQQHSVEIFEYDAESKVLTHKKQIINDAFIRPNAIHVLGKEQFIISNDGTGQMLLTNAIEIVTGYKGGSVVSYDNGETTFLVTRESSPNGMVVNTQNMMMYVAAPNSEKLLVYNINEDFKGVKLNQTIDLMSHPDNLHLAENGDIWIGSHFLFIPILRHLANCEDDSVIVPSQALRVRFSEDHSDYEIYEAFTDDGNSLGGSTFAGPFNNNKNMLIGTICRRLMHCVIEDSNLH